jgi:hypothetical protein
MYEKSGDFSTASLYKELTFPGIENKWMWNIWKASLASENKNFPPASMQ